MRTILLHLILVCLVFNINAQIPNPGFENVSGNKPNNWNTGPLYSFYPIRDTSASYNGTHAAAIYGSVPPAINGAVVQDFSNVMSLLPAALFGHYKFYPEAGDSLIVNVEIWASGNYATRAKNTYTASIITGTSNVYSGFVVPIDYTGYAFSFCDSAYISIYPTGNVSAFGYNWAHPNTIAIIDDLVWLHTTDISEPRPEAIFIKKITPNPTSSSTSLMYELQRDEFIDVSIFDINGKVIYKEMENYYQAKGHYKVELDLSNYSNGLYIVELKSKNGFSVHQKLIKAY